MTEDLRCCGTGTCLINAEGICWCGQRWDGEKMCFPDRPSAVQNPVTEPEATPATPPLSPAQSR